MQNLIAKTVLMVEPAQFGFNEQAAETNAFQKRIDNLNEQEIQEKAKEEFNNFVGILRKEGIEVMVIKDSLKHFTPDAIFPNNWFSTCPHTNKIYTYPMKVELRSNERRDDVLEQIQKFNSFGIDQDLIEYEQKDLALEGTGSLVLDHQNKVAFAVLSPRTDKKPIKDWCKKTGFSTVLFHAYGSAQEEIYHTNVVMTMADEFCIIALDTVTNPMERLDLIDAIENQSHKQIIEISVEQMNQFAGNMIQLRNDKNEKCLVMSASAYDSLDQEQIDVIKQEFNNKIISAAIPTIETIGGGSARCMIAELFQK